LLDSLLQEISWRHRYVAFVMLEERAGSVVVAVC